MHTCILCGHHRSSDSRSRCEECKHLPGRDDSDECDALTAWLKDGKPGPANVTAGPVSLTKVHAVASGKGGVGKSSATLNLECALSGQGLKPG
jgi:Mrp family chromosome partitioning ATPase